MSGHARLVVLGAALLLAGLSPGRAIGQAAAPIPVAQEFEALHFRSIGPATMSGRISDLAVYEADPATYYVGTAHGGVWKTTSNGALFEAQFQDQGLISIGDVTISQTNPDLVWVGAGESNNRQSISFGGGVWKSTDGGATYQHMGLPNSRHINRIVIHPTNNDIVLVAATGPLSGPGGDRGVYKTTDGGRTWRHVLNVDANTGANALVMAKTDPNIMFASTYQRQRNACCMNGGGPGSGVWKSTDGGDTWTRLSGGGLPSGPLGRIAIDVFAQSANVVYALIEGPGGRGGGSGQNVSGVYRSDDGGRTWTLRSNTNPRPMYFSQIRIDPNDVNRIYLGGVGLHMSIDGGETFVTDAAQATHDDVHAIWVNPSNANHVLIGNDGGLAVTYDMSKTWTFLPNLPVGLFYHVSYDMSQPFNVCGGMQDNYNWCGPSAVRHNRGIMNYDWHQIQGGDGFHAIPDLREARIVYTESQNGNMTRRDRVTGESKSIRPNANNVTNLEEGAAGFRFQWDSPMMLSPHDPGTLIVAANRVFRSRDRGDSWEVISPDLTSNADRDTIEVMGVPISEVNISRNDGISNWPTLVSIAQSPSQASIFYTGGDDGVVHVSRDDGRTWQNITANLTGAPRLGWVSEVVPSRFAAGRVYVTIDNHLNNDFEPYIWASDDFGATFRSINGNLRGENVRTLTEDLKNPDVLYIGTETGIFVTLDRGQTWRRLKSNLPTVRIDEITLHPRDNAMLVATHGRALWILDNLAPIQEWAAAQNAQAHLFTPGPALQWKSKDDRNDEFWGHQFWVGENPPTDAVLSYHLRAQANDVRLRITDATGRQVRELEAPDNRRQSGIQTVCWDMRFQPVAAPEPPPVTEAEPSAEEEAGGRGGRAGGGGGRGGRGSGANIPGVPTSMPDPGYMPDNPCSGGGGGGGRGGRGGGGGGGAAGPHVLPGTYNVALVVNGAPAGAAKPLTIVMDPEARLAGAERQRYNTILEDLHALQGRGNLVAGDLNAIYPQMTSINERIGGMGNVPANVKTQFAALNQEFDAVREKFGVPTETAGGGGGRGGRGGGGGGRGGRGGGGGGNDADALQRVGSIKNAIMSIWESPSASLVNESNEARQALTEAMTQADALLTRARALAPTLRTHGLTLDVPAAR